MTAGTPRFVYFFTCQRLIFRISNQVTLRIRDRAEEDHEQKE